jgi:hypothetical protein
MQGAMETDFPAELLENLSVYQDLVLAGRTVRQGQRDCPGRWEAIDPHLPRRGTILDVGSNFGWFGLQVCRTRPECVVASLEADLRSAEVQRRVLASNQCSRVCLLTARASARLARQLEQAGQRLDGVLCLSVLHWMADHRQLLATLGRIAGRILIEHPDPREEGAGVEAIRRAMGPIGDYLRAMFPERPVRRLAQWASHREGRYPRELWLVAEPAGWPDLPSPGLDVAALLGARPGWPAQSWWADQFGTLPQSSTGRSRLLFTPQGLVGEADPRLRRLLGRVPEDAAFAPGRRRLLQARQQLGRLLRRLRLR